MANYSSPAQISALADRVQATNGGTATVKIHASNYNLSGCYSNNRILKCYVNFVNYNYSPDEARQLLDRQIAKFAIMFQPLEAGQTDSEMPPPMQHRAALVEDEMRTGAPIRADLRPDDAVNGDAPLYIVDVYDDDYPRLRSRYDVDGREAFPESLYKTDDIRSAVLQWLRSPPVSAILTIDGSWYGEHWTTGFAVETIHAAKQKQQLVCHQFCGERPGEKGPWPSRVVAHLLAQLAATQDTQTADSGVDVGQSSRSCTSEEVPASELWRIFGCYIMAESMDSVTIVLDRIDALYRVCEDTKTTERFFDFVHGLSCLMRLGPVVRVMMTGLGSKLLDEIRSACIAE